MFEMTSDNIQETLLIFPALFFNKLLQLPLGRKESKYLALTLKAPIMTAADDIHKYFFIVFRENKTIVSSESSARQRIHMKIKPYFLREIKVKN